MSILQPNQNIKLIEDVAKLFPGIFATTLEKCTAMLFLCQQYFEKQ